LGQVVLNGSLGSANGICGVSDQTLTYPLSSGTATVTIHCVSHTIQTNFGCTDLGNPIAEYSQTGVKLPDTITLNDGSFYKFTYESQVAGTVTGRLASVKLPTGGTISYAYTGANNGVNCLDGSVQGLSRTTTDGTWTYTA